MLVVVLKAWVTETNDTPAIEQLHQLGKIGQGPGQPVDLVDDHDIDPAGPDFGQEALEGRAVQGAPGYPAVVIAVRHQPPALVGLALYIGLTGLPLGIQGIELQVQVMLGGFAGIDGAADDLLGRHQDAFLAGPAYPRCAGRRTWVRSTANR